MQMQPHPMQPTISYQQVPGTMTYAPVQHVQYFTQEVPVQMNAGQMNGQMYGHPGAPNGKPYHGHKRASVGTGITFNPLKSGNKDKRNHSNNSGSHGSHSHGSHSHGSHSHGSHSHGSHGSHSHSTSTNHHHH